MEDIIDDEPLPPQEPDSGFLNGIRRSASKEHHRLKAALASERLHVLLERALTACEPGPRVLLREELRRAEREVLTLTKMIKAAHKVLAVTPDKSESPTEQSSWSGSSPLHGAFAAAPAPSEPSSSSSSMGEVQRRALLQFGARTDHQQAATKPGISPLDRQVDAWLRQERVKNLAETQWQATSNGGNSLLFRESVARMELDEAKSQASSLTSDCSESLLYRESKARMLLDESTLCVASRIQVHESTPHESTLCDEPDESHLLRESLLVQARNRALSNMQRLRLEAQRATGIEELRDAKSELAIGIETAKRHGAQEADLAEAEATRRTVHNAIEDLKGSLRAYCCVRPLSSREIELGDTQVVTSLDNMTVQVQNLWERSVFGFDAVFLPSRQEDVFKDCRDLIQSAFDGHNVSIFAYGQTSAGKTHTLFGQPGQPGLAPRMIQEIYKHVKKQRGRFAHTITASMVELYRNELIDLVGPGSGEGKKLAIRVDKHGAVHIDNLVEEACQTAAELAELLDYGQRNRTTRATAMNTQSSRSHLIFTVKINQVNLETGEELRGKIVVCDLAGSERLKKAMVTGDAAKEAIEINKSLSALGDVVAALRQGQKQIPYRNHKLTQLMQDCLGHASKVLMFVNCSPASSNVEETLVALKFATRAKKIKLPAAANAKRTSETASTASTAST